MAERGKMLRRKNDYLDVVVLDTTLDYDGSDFYADDAKDHQVEMASNQDLVVDTATGELKTRRK